MTEAGQCRSAHSQESTPIAFGTYPRKRKNELTSFDIAYLTRVEQGWNGAGEPSTAEEEEGESTPFRCALEEYPPGNTHRATRAIGWSPGLPSKPNVDPEAHIRHGCELTRRWNKRTRTGHRTITVLLDTGAGGGNYPSSTLINDVERFQNSGKPMLSKRGLGHLRAANPIGSNAPPMRILGSCTLALVFPPLHRVFEVTVKSVVRLPCVLILGTAFSFEGSRWFRPPPTSQREPLLPPENK